MYFCPKCNYSFDISKSVKEIDDRKTIDNPIDILKRFKAQKNLSNYIASFPKKDLLENKHYKKLSEEDKQTIEVIFNQTHAFGAIEFKCINCNYRKSINETIKLYQMNVVSQNKIYRTIDDNKLLALNPIYPRTRDYSCHNLNCITHKDIANKEAVYFREKESYQTNYLCCICYTCWLI